MNTAQTIFTAFFGLYFAVTATLTGVFRPFDTPAIYKGQFIALGRLVVSFLLLNIVPVVYFVVVYHWLSAWSTFAVDLWGMVRLVVLSLAGFGFYRIFFGVMLLKCRGQYIFFGNQGLPQPLQDALKLRDNKATRGFATSHPWLRVGWYNAHPGILLDSVITDDP